MIRQIRRGARCLPGPPLGLMLRLRRNPPSLAVAAAIRGELAQLAVLHAASPMLSPAASSTFHDLHDDDACRDRETNAPTPDTFRNAMT